MLICCFQCVFTCVLLLVYSLAVVNEFTWPSSQSIATSIDSTLCQIQSLSYSCVICAYSVFESRL